MRFIKLPEHTMTDKKLLSILKKSMKNLTCHSKSVTVTIPLTEKLPKLPKPTIHITMKAQDKMYGLVNTFATEVAWHGIVHYNQDTNTYTIEDILVYPQIVQGAYVESDDEFYPTWMMDLPDHEFNSLRLQGHSHVRFPVAPSGRDQEYYHAIMEQGPTFYIFVIINKQGAMWIELRDLVNNIVYEKEDLTLEYASTVWAKQQRTDWTRLIAADPAPTPAIVTYPPARTPVEQFRRNY